MLPGKRGRAPVPQGLPTRARGPCPTVPVLIAPLPPPLPRSPHSRSSQANEHRCAPKHTIACARARGRTPRAATSNVKKRRTRARSVPRQIRTQIIAPLPETGGMYTRRYSFLSISLSLSLALSVTNGSGRDVLPVSRPFRFRVPREFGDLRGIAARGIRGNRTRSAMAADIFGTGSSEDTGTPDVAAGGEGGLRRGMYERQLDESREIEGDRGVASRIFRASDDEWIVLGVAAPRPVASAMCACPRMYVCAYVRTYVRACARTPRTLARGGRVNCTYKFTYRTWQVSRSTRGVRVPTVQPRNPIFAALAATWRRRKYPSLSTHVRETHTHRGQRHGDAHTSGKRNGAYK